MADFFYGTAKMKSLIAVITISGAVLMTFPVQAASYVGQCVFPKTETTKAGMMKLKRPVFIYASPDESSSKQSLQALMAFSVKAAAKGGYIQLVTVPDYDLANPDSVAGKVIGWAKSSDFDLQDLRNCD
ncbi:hypothetical protein AADG64_23865 [Achromobacter xylosoxidans]|uniref:hypothetical protein n=1 Tax=Alcaligenes xylosoxydans xylosoxydans TaxID=85698 RepID=UPI00336A7E8F